MTLVLVTQPRFQYDAVPRADPLPGDARPGDVLTLPGLPGDARPGDVLTLPGGTLVRDAYENGRVDGEDGRLRGRYVDVRV